MEAPGGSWGRHPTAQQTLVALHDRTAPLPDFEGSALPYGNGRSYGDSCLNDRGTLLRTRGLDRFIAFDAERGVLRCEAGVLLADILALVRGRGWFLPVTPGTKYVTVGGAIANDVHGKNHHVAGCFSRHVLGFELLRSDGSRLHCSPTDNAAWFAATVGGLGLTGLVTWVELQLKRVRGPYLNCETHRFGHLREFFALSEASEPDYEYTVAWVDCTARGSALGRGHFIRANHAPTAEGPAPPRRRLRVPVTPPVCLVNGASLRVFNALYYHRQRRPVAHALCHYEPYFYPLDAIGEWNRLYGPRGFFQYQCVVPPQASEAAITELLQRIAAGGDGSFLAVLKVFGQQPSAGILSFPRPGTTLALDFPNKGEATLALLDRLDDVVAAAGGAVYPAKDARLSAARFRRYFPQWESMQPYLDPRFSSSFWRRVTE